MKLIKYIIPLVVMVGFLIFLTYTLKVDYPELVVKYKVLTLRGDTFDMDVTVLITEDVAFAAKYIKENSDSTINFEDFDARAVSFPINEGRSPIIWLSDANDKGIVAHEIFHTALNVLYWTGMELNSETEEAFAYEVQHLTNSFYNQINIIK
jgi:hypothetical protein